MVDDGEVAITRGGVVINAADRAETGAVVSTEGRDGEDADDRVAERRVEIDDFVDDWIGLAFNRLSFEELAEGDGERPLDAGEAPAALGAPGTRRSAAYHDAIGDLLENQVALNGSIDPRATDGESLEGSIREEWAARAGAVEKISDIGSELSHLSLRAPRWARQAGKRSGPPNPGRFPVGAVA